VKLQLDSQNQRVTHAAFGRHIRVGLEHIT